jgi:hypothetical protein
MTAPSPPFSATATVPAAVPSPAPTSAVVAPAAGASADPADVLSTGAEVTAHLAVEPIDHERRLRAEVDGQVIWTTLIEAGVALSLRTTMTVPDGEGSVRIVESSGDRDRSVFTADVGVPAMPTSDSVASSPAPPVAEAIPVESRSEEGFGSEGDGEPNQYDHSTAPAVGPRRSANPERPTRVPPELFMLSVGVSSIEKTGQSVGDLEYAGDDAAAVTDRFRTGSDGLFDKVHSWLLVDADATKAKLVAARDELVTAVQARSKRKEDEHLRARDVVLLFFSGHGVTRRDPDGGRDDFFLVTHDFISEDAPGTAVRFADLIEPFFTVRDVELVVLIDACRTAPAGLDFIERVDPEELVKRLKAPSEQAQHFLCSTSGDQLSYEYRFPYPYNRRRGQMIGHGLFTHAILKRMDEVAAVSMSGLADGVDEALHLWTGTWAEDRRQEPTQYLYGGGRYLRLHRRR